MSAMCPVWCATDRDDREWTTHVSESLAAGDARITGWLEQADDEDKPRVQVLAIGMNLSGPVNDLEDLGVGEAFAVSTLLLDLCGLAIGSRA